MTHYYRLLIQYKGTRYNGWQQQTGQAGLTVQGEFNKALETISKGKVHTLGSGRTDAGVHALGQVVKAGIELEIVPENLVKALNSNLPDDIRVLSGEISDYEFMPTVHAQAKEYQYRFTTGRGSTAFQTDLIANFGHEVDIAKMQTACSVLIGEHDFTNYFCEGTEVSSTVREIFECEMLTIEQGQWNMLPAHYVFRIVGNGFLKQMVRLLMGALWNVGRGKISIEEFKNSLTSIKTQRMGPVAPPEGLYMVRVKY